MKNDKVSVSVKTLFILSAIFSGLMFFILQVSFNLRNHIFLNLIEMMIGTILGFVFLIFTIFSIIDFAQNKIVRKKVACMYFTILGFIVLFLIGGSIVFSYLDTKMEENLSDKALALISKVENANEYVLRYDDIKKIYPDAKSLSKNSYALTDGETIYVCVEDKNRIVYGWNGNLDYSKGKKCELDLTKSENEFALEPYVKKYLEEKYDIEIDTIYTNVEGSFCIDGGCISGTGHIESFTVFYNRKSYKVTIQFDKSGKIEVIDDIEGV